MTNNDIVQRVLRETVASYGPGGVSLAEAKESATATLMVEVRAGRFLIDEELAIRSMLAKADESDGRAADRFIERASHGEVPLESTDLDFVVTLGGGLRKVWLDVTPDDLQQMVDVRYANFRSVRTSFMTFRNQVAMILPVVQQHGTVGAAFAAGGFPPADLISEAGAA